MELSSRPQIWYHFLSFIAFLCENFKQKIPTSRQKSHENHEQKNTQKITIITSNKPQNRGKITDFFKKVLI